DLLRIPAVLPEDLLPEEGPPPRMTLALFPRTYAGVSLLELLCLILLLKRSKAGAVFEFGTYKGVSTTQLALNLPENGSVATLDLPEDHAAALLNISDPLERQLAEEKGKGGLVPAELRSRIRFL